MLILAYVVSAVIYIVMRPPWRSIGPSLLDSYVIGVALFAVGTLLIGYGQRSGDVESVRTIGLVAGIFSLLGGAAWGRLFRSQVSSLRFWSWTRELTMSPAERSIMKVGLLFSAFVCVAYVVAIMASPGLRALIVDGVQEHASTLWRIGITNGQYGYFGVGYVKQFRDIMAPVLCGAALLIGERQGRWPFWIGMLAALVAIFITQERLTVIEFALCLVGAYLIAAVLGRHPWRMLPVPQAIVLLAALIGLMGLMTVWLGRLPANPPPGQGATVEDGSGASIGDGWAPTAPHLDFAQPEAVGVVINAFNTASEVVVALANRSLTVVPLENVESYREWGGDAPVYGRGWLALLNGLLPGRQTDISTTLSADIYGAKGGGNSPLALATDLYYNWGLFGAGAFSAVFGLAFLALDIALVKRRSAILSAAKVYIFCAIPTMYNFYGFLLYGGAVALLLLLAVAVVRDKWLPIPFLR